MKKSDFYYDLPEKLIAQYPTDKRDESRMMIIDKSSGEIKHSVFKHIINELKEGDVLVLNDTKVLPARLYGKRNTGGKIEVLLLHPFSDDIWEALVKPGRRAKEGEFITFGDNFTGLIVDILPNGNRKIKLSYNGPFEDILDKYGNMPLPPYIHEKLDDKNRYQTVYANVEGSSAAPTAGLHFTKELLNEIEKKGVIITYVTLHVGVGTFRPVKEDDLTRHEMHEEYYEISQDTCDIINLAKKEGRRIISVGTTSTRVIESAAQHANEDGTLKSEACLTDIFIYPPYKFKVVDCLITNFHLPESTLIMLVSSLAGHKLIMKSYKEAIKKQYRFFSFGDCMLIK